MIDFIYELFAKLGYPKPLHPSMTHMPEGLVVAIFILVLIAVLFRRNMLSSSAYLRLLVLTLFFSLIAIISGYMDWQHYYAGAWLTPIKIKLVLSGVLIVLLILCLLHGLRTEGESISRLAMYALCFVTVVGLGYFGGELIWGERPTTPLEASARFRPGKKLFSKHCDACHPGGIDIVTSPNLTDFRSFRAVLRSPERAGVPGMRPFPSSEISEDQVMLLYEYLIALYVTNVYVPSEE